MTIDHSWMKDDRLSKEYEDEVIQFLELTEKNLPNDNGNFLCPCKIFRNTQKHPSVVTFNHLGCDGIIEILHEMGMAW